MNIINKIKELLKKVFKKDKMIEPANEVIEIENSLDQLYKNHKVYESKNDTIGMIKENPKLINELTFQRLVQLNELLDERILELETRIDESNIN